MFANRHKYTKRLLAQPGFTLIELLVVVVIITILAGYVVPKFMDKPDEARIARVQSDIRNISAALDMYRLDNFTYPTSDQGLEALVTAPGNLPNGARYQKGGYLDRMPKDPWGTVYNYLQPGSRGEYDIYSFGADGSPGGQGVNADVGNWEGE
ncbi:General secretion pathway protein G [hydrothermal vent metagenome]|uniref:Type II secretion system core protein G n=1 Tax=hydrothermal vent metagenome TaxID=652676 RepID=A0A3B1BT66_9ZZZZ